MYCIDILQFISFGSFLSLWRGRWICSTWKWRTTKKQWLEIAIAEKWRTKSQRCNLQNLENDWGALFSITMQSIGLVTEFSLVGHVNDEMHRSTLLDLLSRWPSCNFWSRQKQQKLLSIYTFKNFARFFYSRRHFLWQVSQIPRVRFGPSLSQYCIW